MPNEKIQNYEAAEEHYRKAISLDRRSPDAHYNLGCLLQHQTNDLVEAERQYRQAIKRDPKHGMAQYNLGWVLEKVSHTVRRTYTKVLLKNYTNKRLKLYE